MNWKPERESIGLPPRVFMYTADQIATMFELREEYVRKVLFFYDRREPGLTPKTKMRAVNIAPEGETPEWRVTEKELIRYLRHRGVKYYDRGYGL
jgi:hypothetical protein